MSDNNKFENGVNETLENNNSPEITEQVAEVETQVSEENKDTANNQKKKCSVKAFFKNIFSKNSLIGIFTC